MELAGPLASRWMSLPLSSYLPLKALGVLAAALLPRCALLACLLGPSSPLHSDPLVLPLGSQHPAYGRSHGNPGAAICTLYVWLLSLSQPEGPWELSQ